MVDMALETGDESGMSGDLADAAALDGVVVVAGLGVGELILELANSREPGRRVQCLGSLAPNSLDPRSLR
jgi:hypothetical protein